MKIIRLQLPGNFIEKLGFVDLFQELEHVEILNAFQYDQNHFYALLRVLIKSDIKKVNFNEVIKRSFNPTSFEILEQLNNEIIFIMNQTNLEGFFPIIDSGPWAFLFPITISKEIVLVNIITQKDYFSKLNEALSSFTKSYQIIGMTDINKIKKIDATLGRYSIPFPNFTKKQHEIASFAAKHGYFKSPKKINAEKIAKHFKISVSAVNKHLKNTRNIAMEYFFGKFI